MLKGKSKHRRNQSEFFTIPQQVKPKKKDRPSTAQSTTKKTSTGKGLGTNMIHSLIAKSSCKVPTKRVIVEHIEDDGSSEDDLEDEFFRFGKRDRFQNTLPPMEEIVEMADTGSYSQRNTEMRTENKQNMRELTNRRRQEQEPRRSRIHFEGMLNTNHRVKDTQTQRAFHNGSKRSTSKSNRSHDCSQSTVELKTRKTRSKSKGGSLRRTEGLQRQVRMLWDCIGDIWMKNKEAEKMAKWHLRSLEELMHRSDIYERQLLDLKLQCKSERTMGEKVRPV